MKNKRRRRANRRFRRFIGLSFLGILVLFGWPMILQESQIQKMQAEEAQLLAEKARLTETIEDLKHQDEMKETMAFVEAVARQKLGMIRYNEMIVKDIREESPKEDDPISAYKESLKKFEKDEGKNPVKDSKDREESSESGQ